MPPVASAVAKVRSRLDALIADLFGLDAKGTGQRRSLFDYFHGRSKLSTWLRALLSRRHIDALRAGRRPMSLDGPASLTTASLDRSSSASPELTLEHLPARIPWELAVDDEE